MMSLALTAPVGDTSFWTLAPGVGSKARLRTTASEVAPSCELTAHDAAEDRRQQPERVGDRDAVRVALDAVAEIWSDDPRRGQALGGRHEWLAGGVAQAVQLVLDPPDDVVRIAAARAGRVIAEGTPRPEDRSLLDGVLYRDVGVERPPEVGGGGEDEQEDRRHEGELDQALAQVAASSAAPEE